MCMIICIISNMKQTISLTVYMMQGAWHDKKSKVVIFTSEKMDPSLNNIFLVLFPLSLRWRDLGSLFILRNISSSRSFLLQKETLGYFAYSWKKFPGQITVFAWTSLLKLYLNASKPKYLLVHNFYYYCCCFPQVKMPMVQIDLSQRLWNIRCHVHKNPSHPPAVFLCFFVGTPSN